MSKISVQARMDEFFYRELLKYLKLAEERRRWNVFTDIPWHEANPETEATLAHCVETFCAVEMYLPDFTSTLLRMIRQSRGRSWFHINWGYEESKHSLALEAWLLASGHRTEAQRAAAEEELLALEWELPYDHPRQMVCYTMIQELATFWNYRNLERLAKEQNDFALIAALRLISVDERVHYNFFRNVVKEWMKHDEAGTVDDLKYVFEHFSMPGRRQIPRYDESARVLAKTGIYGPREYIKLVKNPILEDLKIDKEFKRIESAEEVEAALKKAELETMKREQIQVTNGSAAPKNSSPLNGQFDPAAVKRAPFLEVVGIDAKQRAEGPGKSFILSDDDIRNQPLPGSRGMPQLNNDLDQKLMAIGDEKSNNAEEMRDERRDIGRMRGARFRRELREMQEGKEEKDGDEKKE